jgi:pimeloyl-ACP methyl ester carboxylesterase
MALINRWSHSPRAFQGAVGGHGLWLPALNLRIMERQPAGTLFNDLSACNGYRQGKAAAEQIDCPVTIIAGTADRMTSIKAANRLIGLLPHARLVELDDVGHALMAEAPEAVATVIAATFNPSA